MPKIANTRRFKRMHAHSLVKYQAAESYGSKEPLLSNVKDISAGGMRFWSESFFPEGTLLRVSVWIPVLDKPFDALARVVRTRTAFGSGIYYLSLRFIEVNQEQQAALDRFIETIANDPKTRRYVDDFAFVRRQTAGKA